MSRPQPSRRSGVVTGHVLPIIVATLFLLPLWWMITTALREPGLPPPRSIEWLPTSPSPGSFAAVFELLPFGRYLLNSMTVVMLAVPLTIITASMAGFSMALLERRSRAALVVLSVALLLVPITALWLTRFLLFSWVGLGNTLLALVVPALAGSSPLFVLLFYWTFRRISPEIFETAHLDGAGAVTVWRRIALPNARATAVAVAVLTFLMYWSDFIGPLLYLRDQDLYTLPLGLRQLQQLDPTDWPLLMAGAVMLALPAVLFFLVVQHLFLGERGLSNRR
jgi:multiple sugar transport system permease protein